MITIRLRGGLGNQLFQYAFGRSVTDCLSKKTGRPVKLALDTHDFDDPRYASRNTARVYGLGVFNIKAELISLELHKRFNSIPRKVFGRIKRKFELLVNRGGPWIFNPKYLSAKDGSYLTGYWQSEKYFSDIKEDIKKELTISTPLGSEAKRYEDMISGVLISISLHIRRSDYLNDPGFKNAICGIEYYTQALEYISSKGAGAAAHNLAIRVFVFSDDIDWTRNNLRLSYQTEYVSSPNIQDYEELTLMSLCKHNIIANSTFSWWGAWLNRNPDKIVIAPKVWADPKIPTPDIIPESWIRL